MSERPVVTHSEWGQEVVPSAAELSLRVGEPVWVPAGWPPTVSGPEHVIMLHPGGDGTRNDYQLRGLDEAGRVLIVHGHHRQPGNLESGFQSIEGERFETLARPVGQPVHAVVRTPVFDVHVSGDALSYEASLNLVRGLVEVTSES